jgi:hypothetical protein
MRPRRPITLTGTVTKLEWTNPHARIYIDVKDAKGEMVNWDFELGPPNGLMRRGWNRNSLKAGHVVTIEGFLSKTPRGANARSVKLPGRPSGVRRVVLRHRPRAGRPHVDEVGPGNRLAGWFVY